MSGKKGQKTRISTWQFKIYLLLRDDNRRNQSLVFKNGEKMALRAPYVVICPKDLWTFMK